MMSIVRRWYYVSSWRCCCRISCSCSFTVLLFFCCLVGVYVRRYASLYFLAAIEPGDNELVTLEVIHRFVELLDKYFGNVSACLKCAV